MRLLRRYMELRRQRKDRKAFKVMDLKARNTARVYNAIIKGKAALL